MKGIVSDAIKQELLNLKKEDLTVSYIIQTFGTTTSKENGKFVVSQPHFTQSDKMNLSAGEYINTKDITTNVGLFLFNKLLIEGRLETVIPDGYWNTPMDKKSFGKLMDIISNALLTNKIKVIPTVVDFLKDYEFYGLKLVTAFSPSYTLNMLMPETDIDEEKEKAVTANPNMSVQDMTKLEDKLVSQSRDKLKEDPAMVLYNSGARGDFSNDHKNMVIAVGPVENPVTGKYDYMKSNYMQGIQKDDLVAAGNIVVTSEYPKAVGTQKGGYLTKQFYAVFQSIIIDEPGTDCGTKECIHIFIDKSNVEDFYDQYIVKDSGDLELLTSDTASKYLNSTVKLRSPMFCLNDKICSKCAGERFTKMGVSAAGLTTTQLPNKLLNASLKKRHNMKSKMDSVDINDLILNM